MTSQTRTDRLPANRVPEITLFFWIIKVLCTTVGETAADFLNTRFNLGLTGTSLVMGGLLVVAMIFQFREKKYLPGLYWLCVVLISIVGTLITDNLTDNFHLPLETATAIFGFLLAMTFAAWFVVEKTLSMHTIYTFRREAFYWLAILFTFALGTAAGDLAAERLQLGYLLSGAIFAGFIAVIAILHLGARDIQPQRRRASDAVLAFWLAYILTRPLGATIGDYLSQPASDGGLGLGAVITSAVFLAAILATVIYLSVTRKDVTTPDKLQEP